MRLYKSLYLTLEKKVDISQNAFKMNNVGRQMHQHTPDQVLINTCHLDSLVITFGSTFQIILNKCFVVFFFTLNKGVYLCVLLFIINFCGSNDCVLFVNFCHSTGFKKSAILPTVSRGLPASSGVCLHSSHAALSARFHHDLYCPPQVRRAYCILKGNTHMPVCTLKKLLVTLKASVCSSNSM